MDRSWRVSVCAVRSRNDWISSRSHLTDVLVNSQGGCLWFYHDLGRVDFEDSVLGCKVRRLHGAKRDWGLTTLYERVTSQVLSTQTSLILQTSFRIRLAGCLIDGHTK